MAPTVELEAGSRINPAGPETPRRVALSSAQQRFFALQLQAPERTAYNMPLACLIEGDFDLERLEAAVQQVIARHPALRSCFRAEDGEIFQEVFERVAFRVERREGTGAEPAAEVARCIRPFDLAVAPLLRCEVVSRGPNAALLYLDVHHIVCDGISLNVILGEIAAAYNGRPLPAVPPSYHAFVDRQHAWLGGPEFGRQEEYWSRQFADVPPSLDLAATCHVAANAASGAPGRVTAELGPELTAQLREAGGVLGVTPYVYLLSALAVLLQRLTGRTDLAIGSPFAGRYEAEWERTVGPFLNALPLRIRLRPEQSFVSLLEDVRAVFLEAFEHQAYPFEQLVARVPGAREPGKNPLFDVMFVMQNMALDAVAFAGAVTTPVTFHERDSKLDLLISGVEFAGSLTLTADYAGGVLTREHVVSLVESLARVVRQTLDDPGVAITDLQLRDPAIEPPESPDDDAGVTPPGFLDRLDDRIARDADGVALLYPEAGTREPGVPPGWRALTAREFGARVDALASCLRRDHAVGPDTPVALLMDRSVEMVVATWAVLRAGGTFVPIDPRAPVERINFCLADTAAPVLLTRGSLPAGVVPAGASLDVLTVPATGPVATFAPRRPDQLAYVMYTSGSTGRPKGVAVPDAGVINVLSEAETAYPLRRTDTYLCKTSYTFDISILETVGWLFGAGRLAILDVGAEREPQRLAEAMAEVGVTHVNFVPSMLSTFIEYCEAAGTVSALAGLTYLLVAGEAFTVSLRERLRRLGVLDRARNLYGPTETSIYSLRYSLADVETSDAVPIGRLVPRVRGYVMSGAGAVVPLGFQGELCLSGVAVARGYLNQPEMTHRSFSPDPFVPGATLYHTGDIVEEREGGVYRYHGRRDGQVKIRGYRLELGEVENALSRVAGVHAAAVVVRGSAEVGPMLVGYWTGPATDPDIRRALGAVLPSYMVPARLVRLDAFPVTVSGKIDRRALPEPPANDAPASAERGASATEDVLVEAWCRVLGLSAIGRDDNFFTLGGDSIRAIQVCSRLRSAGYQLKVSDLMRAPTVRGAAAAMRRAVVEVAPTTSAGSQPLTPIQRWYVHGPATNHPRWAHAAFVRMGTASSAEDVRRVLARLVAHHPALRARLSADRTSLWIPSANDVDPFLLENRHLAEVTAEAVNTLTQELRSYLHLTRGPLMAAARVSVGRETYLLWVVHHLVVDGVSWRVLLEDLQLGLDASAAGRPVMLPAPTAPAAAWTAAWQGAYADGRLEREADYWRAILAERVRGVGGDGGRGGGAEETVLECDPEETASLFAEARRAYQAEPQHALLAALGLALNAVGGEGAYRIALEGHGRDLPWGDADVTRTVGWFTSLCPFRLRPIAARTAAEYLIGTKDDARGIPHGGAGFGVLRYLAKDPRVAGTQPYAEIAFNFFGQMSATAPGSARRVALAALTPDERGYQPVFPAVVEAVVVDGRLRVTFTAARAHFGPEWVHALRAAFAIALDALHDGCRADAVGRATLSDFSATDLTAEELESLEAQLMATAE